MIPSRAHAAILAFVLTLVFSARGAQTPEIVSFRTADGGLIRGTLYTGGDRAIVLAHGAAFNKESWDEQARTLSDAGYLVLAIDFRGYGESKAGSDPSALHEDILGAIRYLRSRGATGVSVVGGSLGANAAALASVHSNKGEIDRLILIAPTDVSSASELAANEIVFIVSRGDRNYREVVAAWKQAPEPKSLEVLEGEAHAQHIFRTTEGGKLMRLLLRYLE